MVVGSRVVQLGYPISNQENSDPENEYSVSHISKIFWLIVGYPIFKLDRWIMDGFSWIALVARDQVE